MPGKQQPIYQYNTKTKTVSKVPRAVVRATIKAAYNLTTKEEYKKFYDITRNKLRAYQAMHPGEAESPTKFLYITAKSKLNYGSNYEPSARTKAIFATPSISSGRLEEYKSNPSARKAVLDRVKADFQGFINTLPRGYKSQITRLYNRILNDPSIDVKSYQNALDALADKYKAVRDENGEVIAGGHVSGSGAKYEALKGTFHFTDYVSYLE